MLKKLHPLFSKAGFEPLWLSQYMACKYRMAVAFPAWQVCQILQRLLDLLNRRCYRPGLPNELALRLAL